MVLRRSGQYGKVVLTTREEGAKMFPTITNNLTSSRPGGPLAERVFAPPQPTADAQPMLPWRLAPRVTGDPDSIDSATRKRATAITVIAIEALAGLRPLSQLERCFAPSLFHLMSHLRQSRQAVGLRVRSIRLQTPCPNVIEVSVHLRQRKRSYAAALRLIQRRTGWTCTKFEIALQPDKVMRAAAPERRTG